MDGQHEAAAQADALRRQVEAITFERDGLQRRCAALAAQQTAGVSSTAMREKEMRAEAAVLRELVGSAEAQAEAADAQAAQAAARAAEEQRRSAATHAAELAASSLQIRREAVHAAIAECQQSTRLMLLEASTRQQQALEGAWEQARASWEEERRGLREALTRCELELTASHLDKERMIERIDEACGCMCMRIRTCMCTCMCACVHVRMSA